MEPDDRIRHLRVQLDRLSNLKEWQTSSARNSLVAFCGPDQDHMRRLTRYREES
ncbi:MAG: hypothetical protein R3D46_10115 [Defluviimonas denitrificans]